MAFLLNERGGEAVANVLDQACVSTVNLSEVLAKAAERGGDPEAVLRQIARTPLECAPLSVKAALRAAQLRPLTKSFGLSTGDRICLALADEIGAEAWTTDRRWGELDLGIAIRVLR